MARTMVSAAETAASFEGGPSQTPAGTSREPGQPRIRRERSQKLFREIGLYAPRIQTPTSSKPAPPVYISSSALPSPVDEGSEDPGGPSSFILATRKYNTYPHFARADSSNSTAAQLETSTPHSQYPDQNQIGPQSPPTPLSPLTPRWDSLPNGNTALYAHLSTSTTASVQSSSATASTSPGPLASIEDLPYTDDDDDDEDDDLASETRDEFPSASPISKMSAYDSRPGSGASMHVENFSRPRKPSIRQQYPDSLRVRLANTAAGHPDSAQAENTYNQNLLGPRDRGHSTSSNQSTATFASLPVRPAPDINYHDSVRGRSRQGSRQGNYPPRPTIAYNRFDNHGLSAKDPIPRMASAPSDELRTSYRSQLAFSTTQGTHAAERSSVRTKSSSITSAHGQVDEFSVDDVMGMYEKGFRDDSPGRTHHNHARTDSYPEHDQENENDNDHDHDDSRPGTAMSERSRRRQTILQAMTDHLPRPNPSTNASASTGHLAIRPEIVVRDSTAILGPPSTVEDEEDTVADLPNKHDSGKLVDGDEAFQRPKRQPTGLTLTPEIISDDSRDIYGFKKENQYVTTEQYDSWNNGYTEYMERRRKKWTLFLKESGLMTEDPNRFPQRSAKTKRFVRKGIPPEWRGAAWFYYAGGPAILAKHAGVYDRLLLEKAKTVDNEAIERDLHRTFPDNYRFRSARSNPSAPEEPSESGNGLPKLTIPSGNAARPNETAMISSLRRVLHAFSIYNPRIGYCQSLNFLAGLLLLFVESEEHAFWLLNIITRVYLPGTHEMSLEGANVDLGVLMESLRESMPAVWGKIGGELDGSEPKAKSRRGRGRRGGDLTGRLPPITLCMTAWFMSCFIGTLPIETTLRVWDVFFYEGSKTLFRIALAIFKIGEAEIKTIGDPMEIFQVVQTIPRRLIDANALIEACFKRRNGFGHLSQETVEERRSQRRAGVKAERERVATGGSALEAADVARKGTLFGKRREKRAAEV